MSLTRFIQRPAIKNAFKTHATKERTPPYLRGKPILVPATTKYYILVGTAFDYLARFYLARELRASPVAVHEREWIAQKGVVWLGIEAHQYSDFVSDENLKYWWQAFNEAEAEVESYVGGASDIQRVATVAQNLAQLDFMFRSLKGFDPDFRPRADISDELIRLLELFDPLARLSPQHHCLLNPEFAAASKVDGADADLVIDDRLIDLKVTVKPSVKIDHLLQLAGYAALHRMGGITYPDYEHKSRLQTVELYFARQGVLVQWRIDELFPDGGFERFCPIFKEEVSAFASETEELRRQLGLDRVEPTK